jgi:exodeoxyribonuclease VII large subunit
MKPQHSPQTPFPLTPGQLLQGLQALFAREVFRRFLEEGPYLVRGVFEGQPQKLYGGFYYGDLKGEGASIRLKVPAGILLAGGKAYVLSVSPELNQNGRPPLVLFRVEALLEEGEAPPASGVQLPRRSRDRVDVRGLLLGLLRKGETPALALVLGETGIVDRDVEASLGSARDRYRLDRKRVNLTDPWAVAEALRRAAEGPYHLVALVRGGGEGLEALDRPEVWEAVASCPKPVVVALGHAANTLWVEGLADAAFPTPTALGHFLKETVEAVEREKEAAKLSDLLERAQVEARAAQAERDRLKEKLAQLEREPAFLQHEVARLRQSLALWRWAALLAVAVAVLLLLARG